MMRPRTSGRNDGHIEWGGGADGKGVASDHRGRAGTGPGVLPEPRDKPRQLLQAGSVSSAGTPRGPRSAGELSFVENGSGPGVIEPTADPSIDLEIPGIGVLRIRG